jgi:hypothetical protein
MRTRRNFLKKALGVSLMIGFSGCGELNSSNNTLTVESLRMPQLKITETDRSTDDLGNPFKTVTLKNEGSSGDARMYVFSADSPVNAKKHPTTRDYLSEGASVHHTKEFSIDAGDTRRLTYPSSKGDGYVQIYVRSLNIRADIINRRYNGPITIALVDTKEEVIYKRRQDSIMIGDTKTAEFSLDFPYRLPAIVSVPLGESVKIPDS